jgi:hypothetical protein
MRQDASEPALDADLAAIKPPLAADCIGPLSVTFIDQAKRDSNFVCASESAEIKNTGAIPYVK